MSEAGSSKPEFQAGKTLSRLPQYSCHEFKEEYRLGCGGYGEVRKYHHKELNMVAIKKFKITGDDEMITKTWDMVKREAHTLFCFHHENIVEVLGITEWSNAVGIVMEYVDGGNVKTLLSKINQSELAWDTRLKIAHGIISALSYIHNYSEKKKYCHGDLKPENVLLMKTLVVKLADFGSAALFVATGFSTTATEFVSTNQHTMVYAAPEFLKNPNVQKKTTMDMYSFGSVLYELITTKPPYHGYMGHHSLLPSLIIFAGAKPDTKLVDKTEEELQTDRDRSVFKLLKDLMLRCWDDDPALRPDSKTVEVEVDSNLSQLQQDSCSSRHENEGFEDEAAANKKQRTAGESSQNDRRLSDDVTIQISPPGASHSQSRFDERQASSSSDTVPEKYLHLSRIKSNETFKKPASPQLQSSSSQHQSPLSSDSSPFIGNNALVQDFLDKYKNSLKDKKFEEAEKFKTDLRLFIESHMKATAKDIKLFGNELLGEKLCLESIAIFDTAASFYARMENPDDEKMSICVQRIKDSTEALVCDDDKMKVLVKEHVIPLMRNWLHHAQNTSQVSVKWRCIQVSWVLHSIAWSESFVSQWKEAEQTLRSAILEMREIFGSDANREHGRLFGYLLHNLGFVCDHTSRFEEATSFYRQAIDAFKAGNGYFGKEEQREKDIANGEEGLQNSLRESWEARLKLK